MKAIISSLLLLSPAFAFAAEAPDKQSTTENAKEINHFQTKEVDVNKIKNGTQNAGGGAVTSSSSVKHTAVHNGCTIAGCP